MEAITTRGEEFATSNTAGPGPLHRTAGTAGEGAGPLSRIRPRMRAWFDT